MKPLKPLAGIATLALLWACNNGAPSDTFVELYVDLSIATRAYGDTTDLGRMVRQNILKDYNYTPAQFSRAVDKLVNDPDEWLDFQNRILARLDTLKTIEVERFKQKINTEHLIKHE